MNFPIHEYVFRYFQVLFVFPVAHNTVAAVAKSWNLKFR